MHVRGSCRCSTRAAKLMRSMVARGLPGPALQLELDVIGSMRYNHQPKYTTGSAARVKLGARIAELGQNPLVRTSLWGPIMAVYPKLAVMIGVTPHLWEGEKRVDGDSVFKAVSVWCGQAVPLMQSVCDKAVGARKVLLILPCKIRCFKK